MFIDECCGICPVLQGGGGGASVHSNGDVMAYLEMKVCGIHSKVGADGSNGLASFHDLAGLDHHSVEMTVEGIDEFHFAAAGVAIGVSDQGYIAPALADVMGESNDAIGAGIDRIAKVGIAAATSVPIISEVLWRAEPEAAGFVITCRIGFSDREVETVGKTDADCSGSTKRCQ